MGTVTFGCPVSSFDRWRLKVTVPGWTGTKAAVMGRFRSGVGA
jgi:hypothetical protein